MPESDTHDFKPTYVGGVRRVERAPSERDNPFMMSEEPQSLFKEMIPNNAMGGIVGSIIKEKAGEKQKE